MVTDIIVIILLSVIIIMFGWQMYCKNGLSNVSQQPVYIQQTPPRVAYQPRPVLKKKKKVQKRVEFEEDAKSLGAMDDTLSDIGSIAGKEY
jgi:hypothetical protein